jgi:hypothetical protein
MDEHRYFLIHTAMPSRRTIATKVLKLAEHDEQREIAFELDFLATLSVDQRMEMMERKRREILALLELGGHGRTRQIIKRV